MAMDRVHAVLLTGGSAFGLDTAAGVMRWLEEQGRGVSVGPARVPIVPAAVLFDLWIGDARIRPDAATGYAACVAACEAAPAQGNRGAGLGATVGKLYGIAHATKGGIGTAALKLGGFTVSALVAVNAIGDVLDETGAVLAGARAAEGGGFRGAKAALLRGAGPAAIMSAMAGSATTIGVVATDARLDKAGATRLAQLAHHGLSRCIDPITMHDGDTLFALATGSAGAGGDATTLGVMAAEAVARAIRNAVRAAESLTEPLLPCARDSGLNTPAERSA
jgi:L-aminopeptidase/D-esterase-like protein